MSEPVDLTLSLYGSFDAGDKRHAQEIMTSLGIKRLFDVPQSIADCWWFLGCTNVPETLPSFITPMKRFDPSELVGYGLSREMADELRVFRRLRTNPPGTP